MHKVTYRSTLSHVVFSLLVIVCASLFFKAPASALVLESGSVPSTSTVLEVWLTYTQDNVSPLEINTAAIKTGYSSQKYLSSPVYYLQQFNGDEVIAEYPFNIPNEVVVPPPLNPDDSSPVPNLVRDTLKFSITVEWDETATKIVVADEQKQSIDEFSVELITKKESSYDYETYYVVEEGGISGSPAQQTQDGYVDMVFLGDKFTTSELEDYSQSVNEVIDYLFTYEPFKSRKLGFRFHVIDNTEPLGCEYNDRLLVCSSEKVLSVLNGLAVPQDITSIIVNSEVYGGSGGQFVTVYNGSLRNNMYVHELGHNLGYLDDEYLIASSSRGTNCYEAEPPNQVWESNVTNVEYFLGCENESWYRASETSIMRSLNTEYFNEVSIFYLNKAIDFYVKNVITPTPKPTVTVVPTTIPTEVPTITLEPSVNPTTFPTVYPSPFCFTTDLDCSGSVNALDLTLLLAAFGTSDSNADFDDSGRVNALDLTLLLQDFGNVPVIEP